MEKVSQIGIIRQPFLLSVLAEEGQLRIFAISALVQIVVWPYKSNLSTVGINIAYKIYTNLNVQQDFFISLSQWHCSVLPLVVIVSEALRCLYLVL